MRKANRVFSSKERRIALWSLLIAVAIAGGGFMLDRTTAPPLGVYDHEFSVPAATDIIEAAPVG